jgi:hypothetical protein
MENSQNQQSQWSETEAASSGPKVVVREKWFIHKSFIILKINAKKQPWNLPESYFYNAYQTDSQRSIQAEECFSSVKLISYPFLPLF